MNHEKSSWEQAVLWLRHQPDQAGLVEACFFDEPLIAAAKRYHAGSEWAAIRMLLPARPGRALDLGAGRGISSFALAVDGWKTVALEPNDSSVVGAGAIRSLAQEAKLNIQVSEKWGEDLPFANGSFALVFCRQTLHHARDLAQLCREIARVLKPGGLLIAVREHVISRREDLPTFLEQHPLHRLYGGERAYLLADYTQAIERVGIRLRAILNPFESDINLFPETTSSLKSRIARRIMWPWPRLIPDLCLTWLGNRIQTPGRLYSFVGCKHRDE